MSESDIILVIRGLTNTISIIRERLKKLADELLTDPETIAQLLTRWDADTLSQAARLIDKETAAKVMEALAEIRFDEP